MCQLRDLVVCSVELGLDLVCMLVLEISLAERLGDTSVCSSISDNHQFALLSKNTAVQVSSMERSSTSSIQRSCHARAFSHSTCSAKSRLKVRVVVEEIPDTPSSSPVDSSAVPGTMYIHDIMR